MNEILPFELDHLPPIGHFYLNPLDSFLISDPPGTICLLLKDSKNPEELNRILIFYSFIVKKYKKHHFLC